MSEEKVLEVEKVLKSPDSTDELYRRLPEIKFIEDSGLRSKVERCFLDFCPDYFWTVPASSSGKYHPESHRGKYGLFLHTKRGFVVFEELADSFEAQDLVDDWKRDCGRAAILLHDLYKYGVGEKESHTVSNHDRLAARKLRKELPGEVIGCIDSHNGAWGEGGMPESALEHLHHLSDMVASRESIDCIKVYKPCRELRESFPDLEKWCR